MQITILVESLSALENVDFEANQGEFVSIVGPNGFGKSALLRIIAGLLIPSRGSIAVNGSLVVGPTPDVGDVFQNPVLMSWRTVFGNVLLQAEVRGLNIKGYRQRAFICRVRISRSAPCC